MVYAAPKLISLSSMAYSLVGSLSSSFASTSSSSPHNHFPAPDASSPHRLKQPARSSKADGAAASPYAEAEPQNPSVDSDGATNTTASRSTLLPPHSIGPNSLLTVPVPPQLKTPLFASRITTDGGEATLPTTMSDRSSSVDDDERIGARESQQPAPPPLTNLPRRRPSAVSRTLSASAGSVNRGAGLRLDLGNIANPNATGTTGPKKDEGNSNQNLTLPAAAPPPSALQTAPAVMNNLRASAFPLASIPANTSSRVYVRPTPEQLQERQRQREAAQRRSMPSISPTPSFIRKKSGELVKPSLKSVSMFTKQSGGDKGGARPGVGLTLNLDRLPTASGTRSEPTTPLGSKMVHFDAKLEHVKHFLAEQKPLAVSRDGSPTETSEGGEDFFLHKRGSNGEGASTNSDGGRSSEDEKVRKTLALHVMNMPGYESALDALRARWESEHVRLENLSLAEDGRSVLGIVLVRNLAYGKHVAARFTMDRWQTTSEVTARYVGSVLDGTYDRFEFTIRLADYLGGKIWGRMLEIAIRYSCDDHRDMWDNNQGKNYISLFRRKTLPILHSKSETNSEDEEEEDDVIKKRSDHVGLKVAQLKKSLEKVARSPPAAAASVSSPPSGPGLHGHLIPATSNATSASVGSTIAQPSFVNSRSAADVLQRVGKQSSPSAISPPSALNRAFRLSADPVPPPLSPRRHREGTLAGRYDISSSLRNASLNSPTNVTDQLHSQSSVPFPNSPPPISSTPPSSQVQQTSPFQFSGGIPRQTFVSSNVTFNMRSAGRGSPRDALTPSSTAPGGLANVTGASLTTPYRTSSDSDLPASFQSGSEAPTSPSANFGDDMNMHHHSFHHQLSSGGVWNLGMHDRGEDSQPSYFGLSPSESWDAPIAPLDLGDWSKIPATAAPAGVSVDPSNSSSSSDFTSPPRPPVFEGSGIEHRLNGSPPVSRFHSFPPLSHTIQYGIPSSSITSSSLSVYTPRASEISTSTVTEPPAEKTEGHESPLNSSESSSTPSPSLTADSTAVSSPISPPESLFTPTYSIDTPGGSTSTRNSEMDPKNLGNFLDEYVLSLSLSGIS
jgi:hypothetical protein